MRVRCICLSFALLAWPGIGGNMALGEAAAGPPPKIKPFLAAHCFDCHDAATREAGLDLTVLSWLPDDAANFARWVEVFDRVDAGKMPPESQPRPEMKARDDFLALLRRGLHANSAKRQRTDGRVNLRRLNRVEYERTLHELLAIDTPLKQLLPEDTPAHGFDTVAEGLRISALQIEKYLDAADVAIDAAIQLGPRPEAVKARYSYKDERDIRENLDTPEGHVRDPVSGSKHHIMFKELPDAVVFFSDEYSPTDLRQFSSQQPGRYRIRLSAYGHQSNGQPVTARIYGNDWRQKRLLGYFDMPADEPRVVEFIARLGENEHLVVVPYNTGFDEHGRTVWQVPTGPQYGGIGLAVQWIEVEGPLHDSWPPASVARLFGDVTPRELPPNQRPWRNGRQIAYVFDPESPAEAIRRPIAGFATRAFRRPLLDGEAEGFVALAAAELDAGRSYEEAMRVAFRAILTAPQFLLFDEQPGLLDDYALASRLSYFLTSGPPDDELRRLADDKQLTQSDVLRAQVNRLLDAPGSAAFVTNFTGQWLDLRRIDATSPDSQLYPEFDEMLGPAMVAESEAFFAEVLRHDLPISNFIDSDFLMLNRRLAEHYGIAGVMGEQFQRVARPADSPRGGLLTQAAILKVTANGTVTSPVMRGTWVLKRLLGQPPAPPPPVAAIEPDTRGATTVREQLAKHRDSAACASCHRSIDPPGFALESFDVIGGWRDRYRSIELGDQPTWKLRGRNIWEYKLGPAVDSSGQLEDGRKFEGIRDFKQLLLGQQEQVTRCLAEKLLTYGTGAGIEFADRKAVAGIVQRTIDQGGGLRTLVHEIVQSPTFRGK
jgi:hypothetical protein